LISAVDTNVLLDVFQPDPAFGPASSQALRKAISEGGLIACDVVWAEVSAHFESRHAAGQALGELGVGFSAPTVFSADEAGVVQREYRRRGGTRERVIADFLIGAHAQMAADRLLTRDRGFFRSYFPGLTVVDPST
jgi:predicted nucleic acid-binding protein